MLTPGETVAAILRGVDRNAVSIDGSDILTIETGGWRVHVELDGTRLDYTRGVIAPNGDAFTFHERDDPLDRMKPDERERLQKLCDELHARRL